MESSGSLSSFETKPEIAEFLNVSPPAEAHAILRRPGISVSPILAPEVSGHMVGETGANAANGLGDVGAAL